MESYTRQQLHDLVWSGPTLCDNALSTGGLRRSRGVAAHWLPKDNLKVLNADVPVQIPLRLHRLQQ